MKVTVLNAQTAAEIGHAFGYYDYGEEVGMGAFYRSKDAVATYIAGYVQMTFEGDMLYTTSERGEGYIAYKLHTGTEAEVPCRCAAYKSSFPLHESERTDPYGKCHFQGRHFFTGSNEERKKTLYLCWYGLCAGTVPGTGVYEKSPESGFCGRQLEGRRDLGEYGKLYDLAWYPG